MRTPTLAGQYRRHQYTSDGCTIYICNWCDRSVEVRGEPIQCGWNFCPLCGKSWFTRQECRDHDTPRWVWNLTKSNHYDYCVPYLKPRYRWVVMWRSKWGTGGQWGEWKVEGTHNVTHGTLGAWRDAKYWLDSARRNIQSNSPALEVIQFEYKIGVERV